MPNTAILRVLQTSDVHMHLLPYDYFQDAPDPKRGLALAADVIAAARREGTTLLFDTGDLLQGTPMASLSAHDAPQEHPALIALEQFGYDAVTLGNHDFNFGLDLAIAVFGAMPCPVVQSNVHRPDGTPLFPQTVLLEREVVDAKGDTHLLRIGLLGVLPPQILDWDRDILRGRVTVTDMYAAAQAAAAALRAQGADLVIALAHTGPAEGPQPEGAEHRAHEIAAIAEIDIVLAGHSHKTLPSLDYAQMPDVDGHRSTLAGTPAMMPGPNASNIARMDLTLARDGAGWQIVDHRAQLIPLEDKPACPELTKRLRSHHDRTRRFITQKIAETKAPLTGAHFAFGYDTGQVLMAQAQRWRASMELQADAPLIVSTAPFRIANAPDGLVLPPGPINRCDLFTLYPYPNTMCVLRATGAVLKDWLEHAAGIFSVASNDVVGPLLDPGFPSYDFDTLYGLSYLIDVTAAPGARICNLRHEGRPVAPDDRFLLGTSTYRAYGGGEVPRGEVIWTDTVPITETMEQYLAAHSPVAPAAMLGWSLTAQKDLTVLVTTGPFGKTRHMSLDVDNLQALAQQFQSPYMESREVGAGERLANPVRSGRKQP